MSDPTGLRGLIEHYAEARGVLGSREGGLGDTTTEAHVEAARRSTDEPQEALDAALTAVEALIGAVGNFIEGTDEWANVTTVEALNAAWPRRDDAWWHLLETYANLKKPPPKCCTESLQASISSPSKSTSRRNTPTRRWRRSDERGPSASVPSCERAG